MPAVRVTVDAIFAPSNGPVRDQLSTVTHTTLAPNGTYYILDAGDGVVRAFGNDGKELRQFGRKGDGPGEFRSPLLIAASNDTVIVYEDIRLHVFAADGRVLATVPYVSSRRGFLDIRMATRTPSDWIVLHLASAHSRENVGQPVRDTLELRPLNPASGELGARVVFAPGRVAYWLGSAGWVREPFMSAAPRIVVARDGTIYTSPGDDYRISAFAPDGQPMREITADVAKIPVTFADFRKSLDAEIASLAQRAAPPGSEAAEFLAVLRQEGEKPGHASNRPILGRIIPSPDGTILVERLDLDPRPLVAGDSTTWDLIRADGTVAGRLNFPPRVFPRILDGELLYAVVRDEDNVPQVTRLRLHPAN